MAINFAAQKEVIHVKLPSCTELQVSKKSILEESK